MVTTSTTERDQINKVGSTPRSLGDLYFTQVETGILTTAAIAEADAVPFYCSTATCQLCMTFDAETPSAISTTVTIYSKALAADTVYSANPTAVWTITNKSTRLVSEVFAIGKGWHKLIVSAATITGADAAIGFGTRDV